MAFDAAARRGRVLGDPGWNKRIQAITEVALEAAEKLGPILTDQAPVWRARGWPGNTIRTYQTLQETWLDAATKLLPYIDLDLQASNYDATAAIAAQGIDCARARGHHREAARPILLAIDSYGHPFPCEDAQMMLWCAGCCHADWRYYRWHEMGLPGTLRRGDHDQGKWIGRHIEWMPGVGYPVFD